MSDSEVLCLGLAAQRRSGVPWKTERGILRYVHKHLRHLFPTLLSQSAFNRRLRRLWGRIGKRKAFVAPPLPPSASARLRRRPLPACRAGGAPSTPRRPASDAQPGVTRQCAVWTSGSGGVRVERQGYAK